MTSTPASSLAIAPAAWRPSSDGPVHGGPVRSIGSLGFGRRSHAALVRPARAQAHAARPACRPRGGNSQDMVSLRHVHLAAKLDRSRKGRCTPASNLGEVAITRSGQFPHSGRSWLAATAFKAASSVARAICVPALRSCSNAYCFGALLKKAPQVPVPNVRHLARPCMRLLRIPRAHCLSRSRRCAASAGLRCRQPPALSRAHCHPPDDPTLTPRTSKRATLVDGRTADNHRSLTKM